MREFEVSVKGFLCRSSIGCHFASYFFLDYKSTISRFSMWKKVERSGVLTHLLLIHPFSTS